MTDKTDIDNVRYSLDTQEFFQRQVEDFLSKAGDCALQGTQPVDGLFLLRQFEPTSLEATLYEPVICLILQGQKEIYAGETLVRVGPGESLVVSHDIPVISRITVANPKEPYLAVIVRLELKFLRALYDEVGSLALDDTSSRTLTAQTTHPRIIDTLSRYLLLADDPVERRVLLTQVRRELHYRILSSPHGAMLRKLQDHRSHASHITRAIAYIRTHFRESIVVPELAREVGLSQTALYKHFKRITQTTPIQFQKDLRLLEAKRLLLLGEDSISEVAFEIGYESVSQFSREYSRKFGSPPSNEWNARR